MRIEKAPDENTKTEWLQSLREQIKVTRDYVNTVGDTGKLMQTRMKAYEQERERYQALVKEIQSMGDKTMSMGDPDREAFKSKLAALKLRSNKNRMILRVVESVAKDCGQRSMLEESEVQKIKTKLDSTLSNMQKWSI
jgi:hypothetical protein